MRFIVENHLCYTLPETEVFGVGYKSSCPASFFYPENICDYPSSIVSTNPSVLKLINDNDKSKVKGTSYVALRAGTANVQTKYTDAGVMKVVNGSTYKSRRSMSVNQSWSNTVNFDIKDIFTQNGNVSVDHRYDSRTYTVKANTRGTSKVTVWYTNGNKSEITITAK